MFNRTMNTALDVSREASSLPGVSVVFTSHSPMLSGEHDEDVIELDMRNASSSEKSAVREIASYGWTIEENDEYWRLESDYYPHSTEEMLEVRNPEESTA